MDKEKERKQEQDFNESNSLNIDKISTAKGRPAAKDTKKAGDDTEEQSAADKDIIAPQEQPGTAGKDAATVSEKQDTTVHGAATDTTGGDRVNTAAADLLQGPILPTLLKLSYPILIAMFFVTVFNIVDTFYVSRLGDDALTAMGFTFPIYMFLIAIGAGVTIGISSAVARALGAGEKEFAAETGNRGLLWRWPSASSSPSSVSPLPPRS
jgi:hypothetical protein